MKILILDDSSLRLVKFQHKLIGHKVVCVETAEEAIEELFLEKFDVVSLDHDLNGEVYVPSGPGTGWEVAKFLSDNPDRCPETVCIHSLNQYGRVKMAELLPGAEIRPGNWLPDRIFCSNFG